MTADVGASHTQADATGRIARDVRCIHCGYNLRSLLAEQVCPECNLPVRESLRGDLLQFSDPAWLARLISGMGWIVFACILSMAQDWGLPGIIPWLRLSGRSVILVVFRAFEVAIGSAQVVGVWKITSQEPRPLDAQRWPGLRTIARSLLVAAIAIDLSRAVLMTLAIKWIILLGIGPLLRMDPILRIVTGMISAAGWIMLFVYLVRLARRLPARGLVRLTWVACVLATVSNCLLIFREILNFWANSTTSSGTATSIVATLTWLSPISFLGSAGASLLLATVAGIYRHGLRKTLRQA
jgi:hypothetical protein